MFLGEKAVVNRPNDSPFDLFNIGAGANPFRAQRRQPLRNIDSPSRTGSIAPRPARIVNAHRLVGFDLAVHRFRRRERDFAEWHFDLRMQFTGDVNFARVRQGASTAIIFRFPVFVLCDHIKPLIYPDEIQITQFSVISDP